MACASANGSQVDTCIDRHNQTPASTQQRQPARNQGGIVASSYNILESSRNLLLSLKKEDDVQSVEQQAPRDAVVHLHVTSSAGEGRTNPKGLSYFSKQVVETMTRKGTTTYSAVADNLVQDAKKLSQEEASRGGPAPEDDEQNIRRRVYDALNVLRALGAIKSKNKDISWIGLPKREVESEAALQAERLQMMGTVEAKQIYLLELVNQYKALCNLMQRNNEARQAHAAERKIKLPFVIIMVPSQPNATASVQISESQETASFDFAQGPFQIYDDNFVLRRMGLCSSASENTLMKRRVEKIERNRRLATSA